MKICVRLMPAVVLSLAGLTEVVAQENADSIRAEVDSAATASWEAYAANDVELYFESFAEDAILVESSGREQTKSGYYVEWKDLIEAGGGVTAIDVNFPRSIRLSSDGTMAVVHYISFPTSYRFFDDSSAGGFVDTTIVWMVTDVWSKEGDSWKIVHSHFHEPASSADGE